jgi:TRAP-type C4-dicarboxylate transport system permease small subunit
MKRIKQIFVALALVAGVGMAFMPSQVNAIDLFSKGCQGQTSDVCTSVATDSAPNMVKDIINILLFVLGIIAVIMIIIGGIRYVVSAGDSSAITAAKNTILYAVIGLVVAILAFAIVNFVVGAFK